MGCDIHMHVEYKQYDIVNSKWLCGDYFTLDSRSTLENPNYIFQDLYGYRNYGLFAILADVRNDGSVTCIDRPRGLPDDVSDFVKKNYEDWGMDAHSCSYFTLHELLEFYYDQYDPSVDDGGFKNLIDKIKERADELYIIYDFMWKQNYNRAYALSDKIRIVFWFDN